MARTSPEAHLTRSFIEATMRIPQVPLGAVDLGRTALQLHDGHRMDWQDSMSFPLAGRRLKKLVIATNNVHKKLGLPENPGLEVSLPFAFELVEADLVTAFPSASKHDTIVPRTPELVARSASFIEDPEKRAFVGRVLSAGSELLVRPDVTDFMGEYQKAIVAVALKYADAPPGDPARMAEMNELRQATTDYVRPLMTDELSGLQSDAPPGMEMEVIAHNLTRWEPSPELVAKHFGTPA